MAFSFLRRQKADPRPKNQDQVSIDYRAVALTDVGSVRDNNEDNLVFIRPFDQKTRASHGCLAVVADGMGGYSYGELASKMATEIITRQYFDTEQNIVPALRRSLEKANQAIFQKASSDRRFRGMGTTCTAVVLLNDHIYLGHVGDSRAYLMKKDQVVQLSNDHTLVQHLLDTGKITQEESLSHPQRNVVTKAMGTAAKLQADVMQHSLRFELGDKLLICSDGLYEYVKEDELRQILNSNKLNQAAQYLIDLAKQRGGHDNISVLIVETVQTNQNQANHPTQKLELS